ncbi:hypothetical protein UA08_05572 [Talaromyces atroroseus]|uniref:Kinetochore protein mis14 n=1 Tax=Talaromyces atroroseus TaxID=1441469 RepID=A0A225ATB5_TALAT|nr:hypothetical protein UA08_05572 [Talaromyces atroroseus]OKL58839.1 hypothetical protein UA08_05572 [Talaromyces atroroseus]
MQSPHYRRIELQSPADLTYLYTNTVALSRQKLDLHFPPSAYSDGDNPDPMKERVKELVDQFIRQTYTYASDSITINGLESNSSATNNHSTSQGPFPFPSAFSAPETIEYETYDGNLASRVSSLYAQLESLTTTVAQLRRDAPRKAARTFADTLNDALNKDDAGFEAAAFAHTKQGGQQQQQQQQQQEEDSSKMDIDPNPEWKLDIPFGTDSERERWHSGEMAEVYADTLRTLLRLQGEEEEGRAGDGDDDRNTKAISTTIATAERAERAVEFVERM